MYKDLMLLTKYAKKFGHSTIRELGINDTEYSICTFLYFHSDACQDLISAVLVIDKTTIAKAVNNLVETGLITREQDPDNRRKNKLNITDLGKEKISGATSIYDDWVEALSGCLSENEQNIFNLCLEKLTEKAKELVGDCDDER